MSKSTGSRTEGGGEGISAFRATVQDSPWQGNSAGIRCGRYLLHRFTCAFSFRLHSVFFFSFLCPVSPFSSLYSVCLHNPHRRHLHDNNGSPVGVRLVSLNKQGGSRGMLSSREKIKQIREHILDLLRTALLERILLEWKTEGVSQGGRKITKKQDVRWELFILQLSICFLGSSNSQYSTEISIYHTPSTHIWGQFRVST